MRKIVGIRVICSIVIAVMAAIFCGACNDSPTQDQMDVRAFLDKPFTIHIGQTANVFETGISITFRKYAFDSRCCDFCFCVWEGIAAADLWIQTDDFNGPFYLYLSGSGSDADIEKMKRTLSGYEFSLISLEPIWPYEGLDKTTTVPRPPGEARLVVRLASDSDSLTGSVTPLEIPPITTQVTSFQLNAASAEDHILTIDLSYSGGCNLHYFWAIMSPASFTESDPRSADIYLRHASFDPCDAFFTDRLYFDLTPVMDAYIEEYGRLDPIKLNIYNFFETEPGEKLEVLFNPEE